MGKTGLVLEGGGMRGMYTSGILDVFMEQGIKFDGVIGVSAGALFGINYITGQKGRAIRYNKKYNKDKNYMGIIPLIKEGNIVSTEYAYKKVPRELDPIDEKAFKESTIPFYAGVTNASTGKPEYVRITDPFAQMESLRASGSLPIVSRPVMIDGTPYLDGGISDSIPAKWFYDQGYTKQVVVLTRDITYVKKPFPKWIAKFCLRKYPNMAQSLINRDKMYNEEVALIKQMEQEGKVLIIQPSKPINISKLEKDENKLQAVYDLGRADCLKMLAKVKEICYS